MSRRTVVPAGEGRAVPIDAGWSVAIENVQGGQVGDLFAFASADSTEHLSAAHTRAHNWSMFPSVGQAFCTNRRRPVLTLLEDTLAGAHDMLVPACDPERYRQLGAPGHASCSVNLKVALRGHGVDIADSPQPVNLFMPVPVSADGRLQLVESPARAGDRVVLHVELPIVLVLSACPQDLVPLNAGGLSDLAIETWSATRP